MNIPRRDLDLTRHLVAPSLLELYLVEGDEVEKDHLVYRGDTSPPCCCYLYMGCAMILDTMIR
jgi:hypothetical protein